MIFCSSTDISESRPVNYVATVIYGKRPFSENLQGVAKKIYEQVS